MGNETNKAYNLKLYKAMRASSSYEIKPYKLFPCNSNLELTIEEERVRRDLTANLNMVACYDDGTRQRKTKKAYYETHKVEIAEQQKVYRRTHKDEIAKLQKARYETRKDEIAEKNKVKITCEICGSIHNKAHKSVHLKSKKCQKAFAKTTLQ